MAAARSGSRRSPPASSEPRDTIEDVIEPYPHSAWPHRPHRTRALPQRPRLAPSRPARSRKAARAGLFDQGASSKVMRHLIDCRGRCSLAAAPAAAAQIQPQPAASDYSKDSQLAVPAGPTPTSARRRWRRPRSIPTAMVRPARASSPRTRRSTASTSIRRSRATTGLNSDLNAGAEEKLAAEAQFARFASVCRTFAPDLPADDGRGGRRFRGRRRHHASRPRSPIATSRPPGAIISRTQQQRPAVRAHRPQPGQR